MDPGPSTPMLPSVYLHQPLPQPLVPGHLDITCVAAFSPRPVPQVSLLCSLQSYFVFWVTHIMQTEAVHPQGTHGAFPECLPTEEGMVPTSGHQLAALASAPLALGVRPQPPHPTLSYTLAQDRTLGQAGVTPLQRTTKRSTVGPWLGGGGLNAGGAKAMGPH